MKGIEEKAETENGASTGSATDLTGSATGVVFGW